MSYIPRELAQKVTQLTRAQRGFDSTYPLPWYHPAGPEELSTLETVQAMFNIIADIAGFASLQCTVDVVEDAGDVAAMGRTVGEIEAAIEVLHRGLEHLAGSLRGQAGEGGASRGDES